MSGHNQHSRVSQPVNSSSWNPLQVPSYIPRQPQLAHMSSERPIHSTSMIWPNATPNPADFYNYMALTAAAAANSNHKNPVLDLNPLLPFVRSTPKAMPFSSIDLSLPTTTSLNNLLPLQHSQISPVSGSSMSHYPKAPASTDENGSDSTNSINNRLTDSLAILNEMSGQLASIKSNHDSNYAKDYNEDTKSKQQNQPMELIKDSSNLHDNEPASPLQHLFGSSSSSITPNLNEISKSLLSIFNAQSSPLIASTLPSMNYYHDVTRNRSTTPNDGSPDSQPGSCNGDDSSNNEKKARYRRRKPQKTIRLPNDFHSNPLNEFSANADANADTKGDDKDVSKAVNGTKFTTYSTGMNEMLGTANSILQPTQTQSMDLSQHGNHGNYENGCNGNEMKETEKTPTRNVSNDLQTDEMNNLNLFSTMNYNHLRNNNLTSDISSFSNTDDLVKKVEELVKCNETNDLHLPSYEPNESPKAPPKVPDPIDDVVKNKPSNVDGGKGNEPNGQIDKLQAPMIENEISNIAPFANSTPKQNNNINHTTNGDDQLCVQNGNPLDTIDSNQILETDAKDLTADKNCVSGNDTNRHESQSNVNGINGTNEIVKSADPSNGDSNEQIGANPPSNSSQTETSTKTKTTATTKKTRTARNRNRNNSKTGSKSNKRNVNKSNSNKKTNSNNRLVERTDKSDIKKDSDALAKFRGPYVHIQQNGSQAVINTPLTEETAEKQSKFKKSFISQTAIDRNKIRGLHVSTLSNKYDAVTTDTSWMCVFCKLGPHKYGLGDLFGPFILSTEREEFQLAQIDLHEEVSRKFRAKAGKSGLKSPIPENSASVKKKRKLSQLNDSTTENGSTSQETLNQIEQTNGIDIFFGMTKASEHAYEVWVHEDCVVWSSGVHIIGARVVGLETAVWDSVRHHCVICKQSGAVLSCLKRNCKNVAHAPCAKRSNWILDETTFQCRCRIHGNNETNHIDPDDSHKNN